MMTKQEVADAFYGSECIALDRYEADKLGPERWVYEFEDGTRAEVHIALLDEDGWPMTEPRAED